MSGVTGRGLTDGNASAGDETIFVQPASIDPSQVGFAATFPARHAYASNERRAVNRLLPGTSSAETPSRLITLPFGLTSPRPITNQRPWAFAPVWPSFVASLSSWTFARFVFVPSASPVIVAACDDEAKFGAKWIVMFRTSPGCRSRTLNRTAPKPGATATKLYELQRGLLRFGTNCAVLSRFTDRGVPSGFVPGSVSAI